MAIINNLMLAGIRGVFAGRHTALLRRMGIFQGAGGGNKPPGDQGQKKDQQNKPRDKQHGQQNQPHKNQQNKQAPKQENKEPRRSAKTVEEEEQLIRESVSHLFKQIESQAPAEEPVGHLPKIDRVINPRKTRLTAVKNIAKQISQKTAPTPDDSTEIDIDKLSLQEIILSPMERYKPSVELIDPENGGFPQRQTSEKPAGDRIVEEH